MNWDWEAWDRLAADHRREHTNSLFYSLTPELSVATAWAFNFLAPALFENGAYYEFGVFKGFNLWFAYQYSRPLLRNQEFHFYGFDSFQGMPPNEVHPYWAEGNYAASLEEVRGHLNDNGIPVEGIQLFQGWFSDAYFSQLGEFQPVALAVIDSDLYESCVPVLKFLYPLLKVGSIVILDDWNAYAKDDTKGERRAWNEFIHENPIQTEQLFEFGRYGVCMRITSKE